jgi:hypothetical protein
MIEHDNNIGTGQVQAFAPNLRGDQQDPNIGIAIESLGNLEPVANFGGTSQFEVLYVGEVGEQEEFLQQLDCCVEAGEDYCFVLQQGQRLAEAHLLEQLCQSEVFSAVLPFVTF